MKEQGSDARAEPTLASQQSALRRHRAFAGSLLALAAAILGITFFLPEPSFASGLVRAAAEAALAGGLADWFAVTALFRRPLGLPIPHTAIIPQNKDRIGTGLGQFVAGNFLQPDLVAERLRRIDPAARLGAWLTEPENAARLADWLVALLPQLIRPLEDRGLRELFHRVLERQIAAIEFGPIAARVLRLFVAGGSFAPAVSEALASARELLLAREDLIRETVKARSAWWVPKRVDEHIAQAIVSGLGELLDDLADPASDERRKLDAALAAWVDRFAESADFATTMARLRTELLRHEAVQRHIASVWDTIRRLLLDGLEQPGSALRGSVTGLLGGLGTTLVADAAMREVTNHWIERAVRSVIDPWRSHIGAFIADVVRGWDATIVVERIELAVGRDLQYIRINGTVVGALVGCLLFLLERLPLALP